MASSRQPSLLSLTSSIGLLAVMVLDAAGSAAVSLTWIRLFSMVTKVLLLKQPRGKEGGRKLLGDKSQIQTTPWAVVVTRRRASGLKEARSTFCALCQRTGLADFQVEVSQTRVVKSQHAVTRRRPSGLNSAL